MMSLLATLLIGLIAGFVARAIKPGDDSMGWIMTAALGVAGSFVASYGGAALGLYLPGQPASFIGSVVGAVLLLVVYGLVKRLFVKACGRQQWADVCHASQKSQNNVANIVASLYSYAIENRKVLLFGR